MNNKNLDEVKKVLNQFQKGYIERDVRQLENFVNEMFSKEQDIVVIGTDDFEVFNGSAGAKELVEWDWKYWGDMRLDLKNMKISAGSQTASVIVEGTVSQVVSEEDYYEMAEKDIRKIYESETETKERFIKTCKYANMMMAEISRGDYHIWPLRFSAGLVKENNKWCFVHMHFSHPTVGYPSGRLIK